MSYRSQDSKEQRAKSKEQRAKSAYRFALCEAKSVNSSDVYHEFRLAVDRADDQIDLGRAALTMAACDCALDVDSYLAKIDGIASAVKSRSGDDADVYRIIAALNYVLFRELGFRGNREAYFDARNSFLNEVIDRKLGIPISLSVLYIEIARRLGLRLDGVGFPGHFLVKVRAADEIIIDPFNAGEVKTRESLNELLANLYGGRFGFQPAFLESVTKKQLLTRMLTNLKAIYWNEGSLEKTLSVVERLLILDPASAEHTRDRALIYSKLECFNQARADFETYLTLKPDADDAIEVREEIERLSRRLTQIH
jgi:regulator of sirC expression with transglutaminase-like and TPR domain